MLLPKLIVGNWKMNGLAADSQERTQKIIEGAKLIQKSTMVLCPPTTLSAQIGAQIKGSPVKLGAQDCHFEKSGAFTGSISPEMLRNVGCNYVILGHSERRQHDGETNELVAKKARAAHMNGIITIICVGETIAQRAAREAELVVKNQLKHSLPDTATPETTIVAYEPLWAIGTGQTASKNDIVQMHKVIRGLIANIRILYGGSVKSDNAAEILDLPNVDGVLVGGASLKADEFLKIAASAK